MALTFNETYKRRNSNDPRYGTHLGPHRELVRRTSAILQSCVLIHSSLCCQYINRKVVYMSRSSPADEHGDIPELKATIPIPLSHQSTIIVSSSHQPCLARIVTLPRRASCNASTAQSDSRKATTSFFVSGTRERYLERYPVQLTSPKGFTFAGALFAFSLARMMYFDINNIFCGPGSGMSHAAPGECYHYMNFDRYAIGIRVHLFTILRKCLEKQHVLKQRNTSASSID